MSTGAAAHSEWVFQLILAQGSFETHSVMKAASLSDPMKTKLSEMSKAVMLILMTHCRQNISKVPICKTFFYKEELQDTSSLHFSLMTKIFVALAAVTESLASLHQAICAANFLG